MVRYANYVIACVLAGGMASVQSSEAPAAQVIKQPVFLLCPHRSKFSAWSLYLELDAKAPSKVLRLGLEELTGQNSKDGSFEKVFAAQMDAKVERKSVAVLNAEDFGKKELRIEQHDALHVALEPIADGTIRLSISIRVSASERFVIGGKNRNKNAVSLCFNAQSKTWNALALALEGAGGENLAPAKGIPFSGLLFPLSDSGIHTMLGVLNGSKFVTLMDRTVAKE